ncbi:MAG: glutamine synthetase family protein [Thiogranum sp.]|jgi:glutamine synthetase
MTQTSLPEPDADTLRGLGDLETIDLLIPDCNGLLRGKRINPSGLEKAYSAGICLPASIFGADITGNTSEATGLGFEIGDSDLLCKPVTGTLQAIPWTEHTSAQLLMEMFHEDGRPFPGNPRHILRSVASRLADAGLRAVIAVELEFYLLDNKLDAGGHPQAPVNAHTGQRDATTQVYYIDDLDSYQDFINEVREATRIQRIPADTAVAEYAPGQFEINLEHRDDPLAACDDAILLKRNIKAIAAKHGMQATFMAKPYGQLAGNGLHVHVSLYDPQGNNLLAGGQDHATTPATLCHAIGGLQRSLHEAMLLFAPHANSYRRFQAECFVPLNGSWGYNNRTVALRIPAGEAHDCRIEHRVSGADANPYLVTAAILAGIHHGVSRQIECDAPITGNAYIQTEPEIPRTWHDAQSVFAQSQWVRDYFGEDFQHIFTALKAEELRRFEQQITPLEYQWYLRTV